MKENQPEQISRRRLLKALTAAGGAIAASLLPGEWAKPVVEVGVLPAHAQVTGQTVYRIDCDSTPPSGVITDATDFCLDEVAALLVLVSGAGPVSGVAMTLDCSNEYLFDELPMELNTDASGRALFGPLCGPAEFPPGVTFDLVFSCEDPVNGGTITGQCGTYSLEWRPQ